MIDPHLLWTAAYIAGRASDYDRDHQRLANDSLEFADTMLRIARLRFPLPPPVTNLKDQPAQDEQAEQG